MAVADLSDVRCFYELLGHGEPLLLIPGLGVTSRIWDAVVPELSQHFSLILFDNRGVGQSQAKRHPSRISNFSSDIIELLDYLQVERTHVLGLSLGGVIALRLAADHPQRIDHLVLTSCTDRFTPYLRQVAMLLGRTLGPLRSDAFARTVEVLGSSPTFLDADPEMIEERVRQKREQKVPARAIGRQLRCLAASEIDLERDPITAPTLVLAGEQDLLIPSCYGRSLSNRIARSRFMLVPSAGHNPLVECPDAVLPQIIDFLKTRLVNGAVSSSSSSSNRLTSLFAGGTGR
jgi:pimeloyl-ACP methyl ester carboxylesterase